MPRKSVVNRFDVMQTPATPKPIYFCRWVFYLEQVASLLADEVTNKKNRTRSGLGFSVKPSFYD